MHKLFSTAVLSLLLVTSACQREPAQVEVPAETPPVDTSIETSAQQAEGISMVFGGGLYDKNPEHDAEKLIDSCGRIVSSAFTEEKRGNATVYSWADSGDYVYSYEGPSDTDLGFSPWASTNTAQAGFSARMTGFEAGDEITVKWIDKKLVDMDAQLYEEMVLETQTLTVQACDDGGLYVSDVIAPGLNLSFWGSGIVQLYDGEVLIDSAEYVQPQ